MLKSRQHLNFLAAVVSLSVTPLNCALAEAMVKTVNLGLAVPAPDLESPVSIKQSRHQELAQSTEATDYYQQGMTLLYQRKDLKGAEAAFRKVIELNPNNAKAHYRLGVALIQQNKLEEAIAEYRQAIRIDPNDAAAHNDLGLALTLQGKLEEAITELRQAIRLNPDNAKAYSNLGLALFQQGKTEEAIAEYKQVIRIDPSNAGDYVMLGAALSNQGKTEEAIAALKQARDLFKIQGDTQNAEQIDRMLNELSR